MPFRRARRGVITPSGRCSRARRREASLAVDVLKRLRQKTPPPEPAVFEFRPGEAGQLAAVFAPPRWLRDLGRASWLLVGVFALLLGLVWLLGTTYTIVGPVVAGLIVATVAMPVVSTLARHMPRAAAAGLVLFGLAALAVGGNCGRDRRHHRAARLDLGERLGR